MKKAIIYSILLLFIFSCKKETINHDKYLIFNSDSLNVTGRLLYGNTIIIYPNVAYKVTDGQIYSFDRPSHSNSNYFQLNIDVGVDNHFSSNNIHYSLRNNYIFTVK